MKKIKVLLLLIAFASFLFACAQNPFNGVVTKNVTTNSVDTNHRLGALDDDPAMRTAKGLYHSFSRDASLPASVDLTDQMPPVGNQGAQGSCVGWAVAYACKTFQEGLEEDWDLSLNTHEFSPAWVYNQINGGSDHGSSVSSALNLLVNHGCDTLDGFPYSSTDYTTQPNDASMRRAFRFKADSWAYLPNDVDELKTVLAEEGQAIIFRCAVYPDFDRISKSNPVYDDASGTSRGGHALCIVGYDDEKNAFKFINSWGANWGLSGYGWISYDFVVDGNPIGFAAYHLVDAENGSTESVWANEDLYQSNSTDIYYYGDLYDSDSITLYYTTDNNDISGSIPMYKSSGLWKVAFNVPSDITTVTFTIKDNNNNVDDNDGNGWTMPVSLSYKALFTCTSKTSSKPINGVSFNLRNKETNKTYYGSTNTDGLATVEGLIGGTYEVYGSSGSYKFDNGESNYSFDIEINDQDVAKSFQMTFSNGYVNISFDNNYSMYSCPFIGLNMKLYKDGEFDKYVQIYSGSYGTPYASCWGLKVGSYNLVLDDYTKGYHYETSTTFDISEDDFQVSKTLTVTSTEDNLHKVVYYSAKDCDETNIHYIDNNGNWTTSPGVAMQKYDYEWFRSVVLSDDELTFCFNDNNGTWDSNNDQNYHTTLSDCWVKNGHVYNQKVYDGQVRLYTTAENVPLGSSLKVRISASMYGNEPWGTAYTLYKQQNGIYSTTLYVNNETEFEYKYTCEDNDGNVIWEPMQGNRSTIIPNIKNDEVVFPVIPDADKKATINFYDAKDSSAISGVYVQLKKEGSNTILYSGSTTLAGQIEIEGLSNDTYTITASNYSCHFDNGASTKEWNFTVNGQDYFNTQYLAFAGGSANITFTIENPSQEYTTNPIISQEVAIYKDNNFVENKTIGGYSDPYLYITQLEEGEYHIVLHAIVDDKLFSGELFFDISNPDAKYYSGEMSVTESTPVDLKTIHYYSTATSANIHYQKDDGSWTTAPGEAMTNDGDNWYSITISDKDDIVFCFNDGTTWDNNNGVNYLTSLEECWVKNGLLYNEMPTSKVTFMATTNTIPDGYHIEVRGSVAPLSWGTGIELQNGSGTTRSTTIDIDGDFEYKYTLINDAGNVIWEQLDGNHNASSGQTCYDNPIF